ncbi:MAG: Cu(I)-responsive transcriptional regulator [Burkholderiales bacterium]|nr:Cu(I)-responsive transcriptional regulator [Burkholderiales bacterium]
MNIGQAADAAGVSAKRIRYYEQIGLIDAATRSGAGYRVYEERDLHTLRFIRRSRQLGFSIPEIATLLALWRDRRRSSADVKAVALLHVAEMRAKITELQSMVDTLEELASQCDGDSRPDCPILVELQGVES